MSKRPTNDIFGDGIYLREYVEMAMKNGYVMKILDRILLQEEGNDHEGEFGEVEERAIIRHQKSFGENSSRIERLFGFLFWVLDSLVPSHYQGIACQ